MHAPLDTDVDEQFLRGEAQIVPAFGVIRPILHMRPGDLGWWDLGDEGNRLIRFGHQFGNYDWTNDLRHERQLDPLKGVNSGKATDPVPQPFDVLWRTLFVAVRAERFSEGTLAEHAVGVARLANELCRRISQERAGGESDPPDAVLETYVAERIRRPAPEGCAVVAGSTPVVAFGDPATSSVATVGLNPSRVEFCRDGQLLEGPERRLATLSSLGLATLADANPKTVGRIVGACRRYFWRRPYRGWFGQLDAVLRAVGYSYFDGTGCHLDLVQWATDPTWAQLDRSQRGRLLDDGVPFLAEQLRRSTPKLLLINGAAAWNQAVSMLGVRFQNVAVTETTARTRFAVGHVFGTIPVLAWSTNLQSSWGVTSDLRRNIARRVAELVEVGW
jgi:uracil-DNA glycosylase